MVKYIKNKMMAFTNIFKDSNDLNEKNIVGFSSFAIMVIFAVADIITGLLGKELLISDTIFNSFVIVTLGTFGIDGITKIFKKNNGKIN
tara:strand:+ start:388 stop:654 length:267 start_codon:yes stop_codon:yes gene_type:complete